MQQQQRVEQQQQQGPTMNELSNRFATMQRRFIEFSERAHVLLRMWLSTQKTCTVEVSVDCLTDYLFLSLQGQMNHNQLMVDAVVVVNPPPMHWVKTIARSALVDQMGCVPNVEYGGGGSSFIFKNIPATLAASWPVYARTCVAIQVSNENNNNDDYVSALRRRNSMLEVRVLDLETKLAAAASATTTTTGVSRFTKTMQTPPQLSSSSAVVVATAAAACTTTTTVKDTHSFLLEKRLEAEDSINLLRRVQGEFEGRKRVLDMMHEDQEKRHIETRRADAKKSRNGMALITDEIVRLRAELEVSKKEFSQQQQQQQPSTAASVISGHSAKECFLNGPIVPRRALVIAGFWNVSHNDVLLITPHLVAKFESLDGKIIKRRESQVCFQVDDPKVLIDVVIQTMSEYLPSYKRTQPLVGRAVDV
jgi:hypothetical protein